MSVRTEKVYDVLIIGGGVTGTALAFALRRYTNVPLIGLLEKNPRVAQVNSHPLNNSQTSHDGGTETNYSLEHAKEVKAAATMLRRYVEGKGDPTLFHVTNRMVLAVGRAEVATLERRFRDFKNDYPDLRLSYRDELTRIEPKVVDGRDPNEPICALVSAEGYAINYQRLAEYFLEDARSARNGVEAFFNASVQRVTRSNGLYIVETEENTYTAKALVFAAGSYSLLFAQRFGYGRDYAILPVAGSFFSGGDLLRGKVYRVQIEGMPFAAIHGDPDVLNEHDTRFGPTTKPLPLMERHHYETMRDWARLGLLSSRGRKSLFKILWSKQMLTYVLKNSLFDIPVLGKRLFLREVRPIVPTIRYRDLKLRRGVGGIRPQIVDLNQKKLIMGDVTLIGDRDGDKLIFNTTPSPGASVCLANAKRDAERIVSLLGAGYRFNRFSFEWDLET